MNGLFALLTVFGLLRLIAASVHFTAEGVQARQYDFIIVGGGTAGCLLAARLSDDDVTTVLVVEAGYSDSGEGTDVIHVPFLAGGAVGTKFDWNFTTTPQSGLSNRVIPYARGFVLGGSAAINAMIYARGPKEEYDRIAKVSGDSGWGWDQLQPFIYHNEKHVPQWNNRNESGQYNSTVHGVGPLLTGLTAEPQELDHKVFETVDILPELDFNLDYNSGDGLGWGWIHSTMGYSERSNSAISFLHPALRSRKNVDVLLETRVTRLFPVDGRRNEDFRGVELAKSPNGKTTTLTAKKEVILSAGAVGTPHLLLLSGIGPNALVSAAGVKPGKDLPDVGKGLQDQPMVGIQYRVSNTTLSTFLNNATAMAEAMELWASNRSGILASNNAFNNLAFQRLPSDSPILEKYGDPAAGSRSPHIVYNFASVFVPNQGQTAPTEGNWFTPSIVLQSPTSRGSIEINSTSAFASPIIDPAFFATDFDIETMVEAVKLLQHILDQSPWQGYIIEPFEDAKDLTSDEKIAQYIRTFAGTIRHPVATASISKSSSQSGVVGPDLRVKQTKNLRVVDASIIPFAVGGFPQAEVYIIAERASALIKQTHTLAASVY